LTPLFQSNRVGSFVRTSLRQPEADQPSARAAKMAGVLFCINLLTSGDFTGVGIKFL